MISSVAAEVPGAALVRGIRRKLWAHALITNGVAVAFVALFLMFLFPITMPADAMDTAHRRVLPTFGRYLLFAVPIGALLIEPRYERICAWVRAGQPASDAIRGLVLGYPRRWAAMSFVLWVGGAVVLSAVHAHDFPPRLVIGIAETIVLGGLTCCALQYLMVERIMRPIAALALADGEPPKRPELGVAARIAATWLLATGVPLIGIVAFAIRDVVGDESDSYRVVLAILALSIVSVLVGFSAMLVAARAVADPLTTMREALSKVQNGNLTVRVPVDDASEIGLLEAGFNRMVDGLEERERLRQAFGTFVDPALADRVITGTDLAGEYAEVTLMFLDVRGFTAFSERSEAHEVVAMLNDLFGVIVPVILRHGGHANKFIGDGLLAVFGAPQRHEDHADRAVAAALDISEMIRVRFGGDPSVGIGVNSGKVVVGTVGGGGRLDFTVIGDAVNTAARVESATRQTGDDVLITHETLSLLNSGRERWTERPAVPLKGKSAPVRLFAPEAG